MAPTKRDEPDQEFWGEYHALASREVDRIRRLVETMRQLGRDTDSPASRETFDLGELAKEVVALLSREAMRANVEITLESKPESPKLVAVRDHMHQVFLNLLLNAIQASPAGGKVRLQIFSDPEAEGLCVEVSDSGAGIAEENLSRIFDPFFTTKDPDQGTGLGLMICHRLVMAHGGQIEVRSRENEGSTFCVRLPTGHEMRAPARAEPA